jgi:hypothetical protein
MSEPINEHMKPFNRKITDEEWNEIWRERAKAGPLKKLICDEPESDACLYCNKPANAGTGLCDDCSGYNDGYGSEGV